MNTRYDAAAIAIQLPTEADVLAYVEHFLTLPGAPTPTRLGIEAMGEGGLVKSLREGRSLSIKNANRLVSWMEQWKRDNPPPPAPEWPVGSSGETAGNSGPRSGSETGAALEAAHVPFGHRPGPRAASSPISTTMRESPPPLPASPSSPSSTGPESEAA